MDKHRFILDYEKIRLFREKSFQSLNACAETIDTLQTQIDALQQIEEFQGEAATNIKNYFQEVHQTILSSIRMILDDFHSKINLYENQFMENVDGDPYARIPEDALEEMKGHIKFTYFELDDIIEEINADLRSIEDIVEIQPLSTDAIRIDYEKRIDDLTETEWKIEQLDADFCENEVESLDGLIRDTRNYIKSRQSEKRNITDYETGSCFHTQAYMDLKDMKEICEKYYDENGKEIEEAIQKQWELSEKLERDLLKSQKTEEVMEGAASVGISTVPVVGDIKDVQEAITGVDLVTGEKLSKMEQKISVVCMIIPGVTGKMVTRFGKKFIKVGSEIPGAVVKVGKAVKKNTAKYKVYLRKGWVDEKVNINKYIGETKKALQCIDGFENYSLEVKEIMSLWKEVDISSFNKLTQEEKSIYIKAIQNEGNITPELKEIVIKNGGYLDGLEYRIKSPSSVFEKVYLRPKSTPILEIHDIVRYTEIQEPENLVETTKKTISDLESRGYKVIKLKNTWIDETNPYNGINAQVKSPEGQIFELQFHTPESFALKNSSEMHGLYEQARVLMRDTEEYFKIEDKMFELSENIKVPKNINLIQNYRR